MHTHWLAIQTVSLHPTLRLGQTVQNILPRAIEMALFRQHHQPGNYPMALIIAVSIKLVADTIKRKTKKNFKKLLKKLKL